MTKRTTTAERGGRACNRKTRFICLQRVKRGRPQRSFFPRPLRHLGRLSGFPRCMGQLVRRKDSGLGIICLCLLLLCFFFLWFSLRVCLGVCLCCCLSMSPSRLCSYCISSTSVPVLPLLWLFPFPLLFPSPFYILSLFLIPSLPQFRNSLKPRKCGITTEANNRHKTLLRNHIPTEDQWTLYPMEFTLSLFRQVFEYVFFLIHIFI